MEFHMLYHPDKHPSKYEAYLGHFLESPIRLIKAEPLVKSTRLAPWRLDVVVDGAARSFVLRLDARGMEHEYLVLGAMQATPVPAPRPYGWDPQGEFLGVACYFSDYIEGESLLNYVLAGEDWAENVFLETVCALQSLTRQQLAPVAELFDEDETALDFLENAYAYFQAHPHPLADAVYARLKEDVPALAPRFSNGDLWLDNLIVHDRKLTGVIDFENAGFSDPIYEFLLSFFVRPELCGRGIEERYCQRMGFDPGLLPWYRGLEYFDTWHWVMKTGQPFERHTSESLPAALERWLDQV
jgi:aminoglycoside phosphotransferase (APT) family kinase protein